MRKVGISMLSCAVALLFAAPGLAGDESNMTALLEQWQTAFNADDAAGVATLYAEDGCRMPPNGVTIDGRDAIRASIAKQKEQGVAKVALGLTHSASYGDRAHATGTWAVLGADGMELDHGKWMNVSRKVGEQWMIECDIWNSDLPLPMDDDEDEDDDEDDDD